MEKAKAYRKIGGLEMNKNKHKTWYYYSSDVEQYINERIKKLEKTETEFGEHYWALRELKRLKEII